MHARRDQHHAGGEAIVVEEDRGVLRLLNPTGAIVWQCLDGVSTLAEICADLSEVLGARLADVDVQALVTLMETVPFVGLGLVEPRAGAPALVAEAASLGDPATPFDASR